MAHYGFFGDVPIVYKISSPNTISKYYKKCISRRCMHCPWIKHNVILIVFYQNLNRDKVIIDIHICIN